MLKAGVELGQGQLDREWEKTIIDLFPFDFIIRSVNIKWTMWIWARWPLPMRHRPNGLYQQNLEYLWELVDTCDFDSLGHVDLVKRYAANHGIKVDLREYPDQLMPILRRLAERGKALGDQYLRYWSVPQRGAAFGADLKNV